MNQSPETQAVDLIKPLGEASKPPLNLFGAQRLLCEEISFVRDEMLDRVQTETQLFSEFLSKMAEAHSVNDILAMYEICGQHQLDFIQRDWARLLKHARHLVDVSHREVGTPKVAESAATIQVA